MSSPSLAANAIQAATGVEYQKGNVVNCCYGANDRSSRESLDVFRGLWLRQFRQHKVSLVTAKNHVPKNAVNAEPSYTRNYRGDSHVVFDDPDQNERAFLGEVVGEFLGDTISLLGGICYFDDEGKLDGEIKTFGQVLFTTYREPGKRFDWNSLYLCGNSLCYSWPYKDSAGFGFEGWLLKEDCLCIKYANLNQWRKAENTYDNRWDNAPKQMVGGRWLVVLSKPRVMGSRSSNEKPDQPAMYHGIDLMSIRKRTGEEGAVVYYDSIAFEAQMDPAAVVATLDVQNYEPTERDGFPMNCIKCHQRCVSGIMSYGWDRSKNDLGRSLCQNCRIRYSKGKKSWVCWKVAKCSNNTDDLTHCRCIVNPPKYECSATDHADPASLDCEVFTKVRAGQRGAVQDEIEFQVKVRPQES